MCRTLIFSLAFATAAAAELDDLATGIRQVRDGDFEQGLVTLDTVARRLASQGGPAGDLARAYLHIGVAYVGLGQEDLAQGKFRRALSLDGTLRLSADEFAAKVVRNFEAVRQAIATDARLEKEAKKSKGKGGLILLGAGGAAAAGVAVAVARGTRENRPPTASLAISPEGTAIRQITRLTFTATAEDPDGEPLAYSWDFGDGASATGQTVTHVYERVGLFTVTLAVRDGVSTTGATGMVTVGTLQGSWRVDGVGFRGEREFRIRDIHQGLLEATVVLSNGDALTTGRGTATDPRNVRLEYCDCRRTDSADVCCPCQLTFTGQADAALRTIAGTLACSCPEPWGSCSGQRAITLSR